MTLKSKKVTARRNANVIKGNLLNAKWIHSDYVEYFLRDFARGYKVLNMCCGSSMVGDIRSDIDPNTNRNTNINLFDVLQFFQPGQVEGVICDAPYKAFNPNSRIIKQAAKERHITPPGSLANQWQFDLFKICSKWMITRRPMMNINLPSRYHEYFIIEDSRPSLQLLRIDYK